MREWDEEKARRSSRVKVVSFLQDGTYRCAVFLVSPLAWQRLIQKRGSSEPLHRNKESMAVKRW